jgi:hypothetical protein
MQCSPWYRIACKCSLGVLVKSFTHFYHGCTTEVGYAMYTITILNEECYYQISPGHNPPYLQLRAVYLQNLWIRTWLVPPPYGFRSTQTRRSMSSACKTFSAFELRAGYGFTSSTGNARSLYVHERITHCLLES